MSQPAVSHAIHQLEDYLGVTLFDRSTRPLELTPAGQTYFDGCQSLLDQFQCLEDTVREMSTKVVGRVRVAAIYSVGLLEMSVVLADFEQKFPDVEVTIQYLHPDEVYELVGSGEADFGIVSHPKRGGDWESSPWRTQPMAIVASPSHPWVGRSSIALAELQDQPFIALTPELASRIEIDRRLKQAGVRLRIEHEFDNIDTILRRVADGAGVSIVPRPTVQRELDAGTIVAFDISDGAMERPLGFLQRKNGSLSTAARSLMDSLVEFSQPATSAANPSEQPSVLTDHDSGHQS